MVVRKGRDMGKWYVTAEDIAADLDIGVKESEELMRELAERIKRKGGMAIPGKIPEAYYQQIKSTGFLSSDGAGLEDYPLTEKRLLKLKEFCAYSGLGQNMAREFAKRIGIEKRIGHKVLYDRVLFDKWCDDNGSAGL